MQHSSLQIIVIDSVTTLFRNVDLDLYERSAQLFSLAMILKRVSAENGIQVLVANHVTADFDSDLKAQSSCVKPALGHAWSSCVTHRISLQRADRSHMASRSSVSVHP